MRTSGFTKLEIEVLELLLAGDDPVLDVLRKQFQQASAASREFTGAGFFTSLCVSQAAPRLETHRRFSFGDVHAEIEGMENGAGFELFVEEGAISCLEGFCYDDTWPRVLGQHRLYYVTAEGEVGRGRERDMAGLRANWPR